MTVCYFGMYDSKYSRNRIIVKGLRRNGIEVIECNVRTHLIYGLRYFRLIWKFLKTGIKSDIIFIGFPGQTDVPLAWLLAKIFRKKLVFDVFYSLYNSYVDDRKYYSANSWKAKIWFFVDWFSCLLADKVILDTNAHIDFFVKTFHLSKDKFIRVFVGTDTDVVKRCSLPRHDGFIAGFHGSFLPLQGVPVILQAAKILEKYHDIRFRLLGSGNDYAKCLQIVGNLGLKNVEFLDKIPYEKLAVFISGSDIYLGGPFADSIKSNMVIPNKVFEAIAVGKPVIVGESAATRELLTDKINCCLVRQNDPEALAKAILFLRKNNLLREKIARQGYNLIMQKLKPEDVARQLINELDF